MKKLFFLLRLMVSLILVLFLYNNFGNIDAEVFQNGLKSPLNIAAVLCLLLQYFLATLRWRSYLVALGVIRNFSLDLKLVYLGSFLNQTLPFSVAGDATRAFFRDSKQTKIHILAMSVLLDKATALLTMIVIALATIAFKAGPYKEFFNVPISIGFLLICSPYLGLFLICNFLELSNKKNYATRFYYYLKPVVQMVHDNWEKFLAAHGYGFLSNLLTIFSMYFCTMAMGIHLNLFDACILIPLTIIASTLPISVGGWGVREFTFVQLMAVINVEPHNALAASILFGSLNLVAACPALIFVIGFNRREIHN